MEKKDITLIPQYQKMLEEIMEYRKRNSIASSNSETAENFSTIYPDASHVVLASKTTPDGKHYIWFEWDLTTLSYYLYMDSFILETDSYKEERSTEEAIQFMTREISCAKPDDFLWLDDTMLEKAGCRTCKNGNIIKIQEENKNVFGRIKRLIRWSIRTNGRR